MKLNEETISWIENYFKNDTQEELLKSLKKIKPFKYEIGTKGYVYTSDEVELNAVLVEIVSRYRGTENDNYYTVEVEGYSMNVKEYRILVDKDREKKEKYREM